MGDREGKRVAWRGREEENRDGGEDHFCLELIRPEIRPGDLLLVLEEGLAAHDDLALDRQVLELVENSLGGGEHAKGA